MGPRPNWANGSKSVPGPSGLMGPNGLWPQMGPMGPYDGTQVELGAAILCMNKATPYVSLCGAIRYEQYPGPCLGSCCAPVMFVMSPYKPEIPKVVTT